MKKLKTQEGITLVALIITIVVLLILAVVSIGAVQNSDIIGHAQNAAEGYETEKEKENGKIQNAEDFVEKYASGENQGGVPVPTGFKYVEGTVETGFVIEHETEGSQFVWVPVTKDLNINGYGLNTADNREPDVLVGTTGNEMDLDSTNLERARCEEDSTDNDNLLTEKDFKKQLENEYKLMIESINKNKGFYIGRYEVSINGENKAQSKSWSEDNQIISATNTGEIKDWYGLYALCKTYSTSSVQSSMIWGTQYKALKEWIGENVTNKGENTTNNPGRIKSDVLKNIYDLFGCHDEWTLECVEGVNSDGGRNTYYYYNETCRINPAYPFNDISSRLTLYIK